MSASFSSPMGHRFQTFAGTAPAMPTRKLSPRFSAGPSPHALKEILTAGCLKSVEVEGALAQRAAHDNFDKAIKTIPTDGPVPHPQVGEDQVFSDPTPTLGALNQKTDRQQKRGVIRNFLHNAKAKILKWFGLEKFVDQLKSRLQQLGLIKGQPAAKHFDTRTENFKTRQQKRDQAYLASLGIENTPELQAGLKANGEDPEKIKRTLGWA